MDYKYIEQLIERYWQCETSLEEEKILRSFFAQKEIPAHLLRYKDLFQYEQNESEMKLSDDFDAKILAQLEKPVVKAKRIRMTTRLMPLFRAAAMVALVLSLGNAIQKSYTGSNNEYNYESYKDTYTDPSVAYEEVSSALQMVSESINKSKVQEEVDSTLTEELPETNAITE